MQKRNQWIAKAAAVAGLVGGLALSTAASAAIESSCPAPCARPPKSAIFLREPNGTLGVLGSITPLTGTLLKATAKTVVRVDASVSVTVDASVQAVEVFVTLNGVPPAVGTGLYAIPCDSTRSPYCTVTGSYWWDIDALEASHPGAWLGQPLEIKMVGGNYGVSGQGLTYTSSFSAQVVKKK